MNRIASVTGSYGYCGPCFCRLTFMPLAQIEVNVTVGSPSLVCWLGGSGQRLHTGLYRTALRCGGDWVSL